MDNSKIKDILQKIDAKKAFQFIEEHARYFAAVVLFLLLVLVLVTRVRPDTGGGGADADATEVVLETEEAFEVDAYETVNTLIAQYYAAYAAGDIDTLTTLATPVSANEQSYIVLFSQFVDEYQNIVCYTKSGLDSNSYLVSVAMEVKFAGVDTAAPGLDFFYVRTNEEGTLYIDNLYSQYNRVNQENALDTSVRSLISRFENESDLIALQNEVQAKYDAAVSADAGLAEMIQTTIPNAIDEWVAQNGQENTEAEPEDTETEPEDTEAEETEPDASEGDQGETAETTEEFVYTTDKVNVRAAASTSAERLGSLDKGTKIARTGTDGEWSIVDYGGQTGYIKSEYLTTEEPDAAATGESDAVSLAEGTVITLESAVNIRSGMSETADKVGTAYAGEKVTVVMSYAEGWTKVTWNGKTGYIKSSLLQ